MPNKKRKKHSSPVSDQQASAQIKQSQRQCPITATKVRMTNSTATDLSSTLEVPINILEDLISIAIEEIGNGGGRTLALLLPALRYVDDMKNINQKIMLSETAS